MDWRLIFNRPAPDDRLGGDATAREGVFVTPQSLASFPAASVCAYGVWAALGSFAGDAPFVRTNLCALLVAGCFGAAICFVAMSDPQRPAATTRDTVIQIIVAVINTFMLYAAMRGLDGGAV